jgi:hypothetical protein
MALWSLHRRQEHRVALSNPATAYVAQKKLIVAYVGIAYVHRYKCMYVCMYV